MSRPELYATLRSATPAAPERLRRQVRALAAEATPELRPSRRARRRLAFAGFALAGLAAAAAAGIVLLPGSHHPAESAFGAASGAVARPALPGSLARVGTSQTATSAAAPAQINAALPQPSTSRAQRYQASLRLRLANGAAVATAARRAVAITKALGGYPQTVEVTVTATKGSATLILRVPRARVSEAINELSALGAVIGEHVSIQDLQEGVDTIGIRIVRLERELAAALHAPSTLQSQKLVQALETQILGLQRSRAATLRAASDASVTLALTTPLPVRARPVHHPKPHGGPFHALVTAFRDAGIGAVYALALGLPLVLLGTLCVFVARRLRRRRDERLLSRS